MYSQGFSTPSICFDDGDNQGEGTGFQCTATPPAAAATTSAMTVTQTCHRVPSFNADFLLPWPIPIPISSSKVYASLYRTSNVEVNAYFTGCTNNSIESITNTETASTSMSTSSCEEWSAYWRCVGISWSRLSRYGGFWLEEGHCRGSIGVI
ncbi:hypothetical protein GYMLUDRAFT_594436 [Collybiopsis luxurians FD-317 M1]|uniref:Uncharacterized protein n=1 Tax=Collybiopsis luxurians FD-317 M1 TaxID=944289 RepID=A0A0D0CPF2_9AGAR|nr:hypothetical protein GYMLUDRAFT_594436 [Collybiopsis luxurians FD-317 M1]